MNLPVRLLLVWFSLSLLTCMGFCTGLFAESDRWFPGLRSQEPTEIFPYPHHIPKYPDGVSLRFAMVNDVVHERFPRHGQGFYEDRNRRVRQSLAQLKEQEKGDQPPSMAYYNLLDDLAVGLEFVGEHDEAIRILRDKLKEQESFNVSERGRYGAYANLGTFLILGPFRHIRPGNEEDKKVLQEGLALIQKSIQAKPDAHFGREIWQAILVQYMIALLDRPELLLEYDMIGDRLDTQVDNSKARCLADADNYIHYYHRRTRAFLDHQPGDETERVELRKHIALVGAERGWTEAAEMAIKQPVPFDEPTLGIIGMWRLGGGAHPYFAVTLGEIMLRVGQRYIAWSAFERAATQFIGLAGRGDSTSPGGTLPQEATND